MRNSSQGGKTTSDGFGNSALANRVRSATQRTNQVLAGRGSNQRFDTNTGRSYNVDPTTDTTIPAENINATKPINLPDPIQTEDPGNLAYANNFGLSTPENPVNEQGLFVPPQNLDLGANDYGAGLFNSYMDAKAQIPQVNQEDIYNRTMKESGLNKARKEVNNYQSQLNAITTKAQADVLSLEGQGRGVTEAIIGGQQAQINREAAIRALPVQGQLAAAQGNLELAQQHFSDLFKIRSADAQAQYEYKNKVVDAVYQFATQVQKQRLDELNLKNQNEREDKLTNGNRAFAYAQLALQNGQPQLAGSLMKLDPSDPSFTALLAEQIGQFSTGGADREVTPEESFKYGLPMGSRLSDFNGQILGGGSINPEIQKENDQDFQFAKQARDTAVRNVLIATGKKSVNQLTEADMALLDDTQAFSVSTALSITTNPKATRASGGGADALGATGWWGKLAEPFAQTFTRGGKKYSAKSLLNGIKTIENNYQSILSNQMAQSQSSQDPYASYRTQVPAGQILIERNGEVGYVPSGEFNPSTDKKL